MLDITDMFTGAVLFELHAFDMVNKLSNILNDFNKKKIALWVQMRFVEVFASLLAEKIMAKGTHIMSIPMKLSGQMVRYRNQLRVKAKNPERKSLIQEKVFTAE